MCTHPGLFLLLDFRITTFPIVVNAARRSVHSCSVRCRTVSVNPGGGGHCAVKTPRIYTLPFWEKPADISSRTQVMTPTSQPHMWFGEYFVLAVTLRSGFQIFRYRRHKRVKNYSASVLIVSVVSRSSAVSEWRMLRSLKRVQSGGENNTKWQLYSRLSIKTKAESGKPRTGPPCPGHGPGCGLSACW